MQRFFTCCGLVLVLLAPVRAQEAKPAKPAARPALDLWDAVYLDGAKSGYRHTTVEDVRQGEQPLYRTKQLMYLTVKRYGSVVNQRMSSSTEETPQGKVVGVSLTQHTKDGEITQKGRVEGGQLIVTTPSNPEGQAVPWNNNVLGLYGQEVLFQMRKVKPGERFRFLDYQLALLSAVPVQVQVKDNEEVDVLEVVKEEDKTKARFGRKKLLRVELKPDKVRVGESVVPLPGMSIWLNDKMRPVRSDSEIPGMGRLSLLRTTREVAQAEGVAPDLMDDLGMKSLIRLDTSIDQANDMREITYRITAPDDDDPATLFARDDRQTVENVAGQTFDLRVRAVRTPVEGKNAAQPGKAYLESSYFLDSRNEKIKAAAAEIVGDETDPWRKAQRIEKWVHENMKVGTDVSCCPASEVLKTRRGDCRQHAMLMAALCRAAGIPARTAMGLVYAVEGAQPILAFHMWTEVWVKGQWLMLDAMQATGSVGPTHLKIVDHSWQDIQTLAPLLPALRVIGKIRAGVVDVK